MADFAPVELAMFPLESAPLPDEDLPLHILSPATRRWSVTAWTPRILASVLY